MSKVSYAGNMRHLTIKAAYWAELELVNSLPGWAA